MKVGDDSMDRQNRLTVLQCGAWRWELERVSKRRCGSATADLPKSPGHPFYARLNAVLDAHDFDRFVEGQCAKFYAPVMGRPSLAPGRYFRLLLVGYFEGIDSERGIAWRATDSLAVRSFLRLAVDEPPPDHSTISRTRRADRPGDPPRGLHLGAATAGGGGIAQGQDRRDRRHHAGGQRGDAQHRAARHRGELSGVPDAARAGVGHRDADARGLGAAGPQAQEEDLEQRLDNIRGIPMRRSRR